jgi:glycosyl transferase family 87
MAVAATGVDFHGHFAWLYPPTFLAVVAVLALMPYAGALLAWAGIGIAAYLAAIRAINGTWNATIAALAWPGVLWSVVVGQNGLIIGALLGASLVLVEKRPALAGILFGLLTFKPQFGLLIPIALVAGGHWRVIAWAAASTLALAAASAVAFGANSWVSFFQSLTTTNSAVLEEGLSGFHKVQSVYGYLLLLGGDPAAAWLAQGAFVAMLGAGVAWLWRSRADFDIKATALAAATIAASPYAFMYDMAALGIPLAFLGRTGFSGKELAAVILAGLLVMLGPSPYLPVGLVAALIPLAIAAGRLPTSFSGPAASAQAAEA